jgi:hypothetical protein
MTPSAPHENRCRRIGRNADLSARNGTGVEKAVPATGLKNDVQTKAYGAPVP